VEPTLGDEVEDFQRDQDPAELGGDKAAGGSRAATRPVQKPRLTEAMSAAIVTPAVRARW
jgi:hypothetical protein